MTNGTGKTTIIPRGNMVLLEQLPPADVIHGIHIPSRSQENPLMGKVVAIGPGKEFFNQSTGNMHLCPMRDILIGDTVYFNIRHAIPTSADKNSKLLFIDADHITGVFQCQPTE